MPGTRRGEPAAAGTPPGSLRRALAALCVTEIVSYWVMYYAFPVLAATAAAGAALAATTPAPADEAVPAAAAGTGH